MSEVICKAEIYVHIPIRIYAEHQKFEASTQTYPGCPEAMMIEDIELLMKPEELKDFILKEYDLELEEMAWDNK